MNNLRDIAIRAGKTALQTAVAVLIAAGAGMLDTNVIKTAAVSALAAALSVIQNALLTEKPGGTTRSSEAEPTDA